MIMVRQTKVPNVITHFVDTSTTELESFDQTELNNFVRDLGLLKELSELLASKLKDKNLLQKRTHTHTHM